MNEDELIQIIRRFKNHCYIAGWPSKSFMIKVYQILKQYESIHATDTTINRFNKSKTS